MQKLLIWIFISLAAAGTVDAFDGSRKGFIVTGGLGLAPYGNSSLGISTIFLPQDIGNPTIEVDRIAPAVSLSFGYAWNANNAIFLESNLIIYKSDPTYDRTILQGFLGPAWYYYPGRAGKTLFTSVGVGLYVFEIDGFAGVNPGYGFLLGLGYEFLPHLQVAGYFSYGRASEFSVISNVRETFEHKHFSVLLKALAF